MSSPLPEGPWTRVGTDLLSFKGKTFLVVMDYYSRYLELMYLSSATSSFVIGKLKSIFARWGIPREVVSENGPQFSSDEFASFSKSYGFKHVTSSPCYPQSNGLAECAVKIAKRILRQEDPYLALMVYRSTTLASTGYSPSQIMLNRRMRTTLPSLPQNLQFRAYCKDKVETNHTARRRRNEYYYNRRYSSKPLSKLKKGDKVRIKTGKDDVWSEPAFVINKADEPRSYNVQSGSSVLRRNRRHLLLIPREEDRRGHGQSNSRYRGTETSMVSNNENIVRTRSGRIIRPPDRLTYETTI